MKAGQQPRETQVESHVPAKLLAFPMLLLERVRRLHELNSRYHSPGVHGRKRKLMYLVRYNKARAFMSSQVSCVRRDFPQSSLECYRLYRHHHG